MATIAHLEAILSADTRPFDRSLDSSEKKTHAFSKAFGLAAIGVDAAAPS